MLVGVGRTLIVFLLRQRKLSPCSWGWAALVSIAFCNAVSLSPCSWGWAALTGSLCKGFVVVPMLVGVGRLRR